MNQPSELHLFTDGTDTVIALDVADAAKVYEEFNGLPWSAENSEDGAWSSISDDAPILNHYEERSDAPACATKAECGYWCATLTAREWVAHHGRGLFATSDW